MANLQQASLEADTLLKDLQKSRQAVDEMLSQATDLIGENREAVNASVTDLKKTLYVASQHIDAIAHHLEGASRNMHEFTREIRENPGLLLRGSIPSDKEGE